LAPSDNFIGLYLRSWGMYRQSEKNLLNADTSSTCPRNMVNFGLLTDEICWRVWGTPANFHGFRVLAALLHGTVIVGVSQTAALNRGRHLYLAGRPSRWALAHIVVLYVTAYVKILIHCCRLFWNLDLLFTSKLVRKRRASLYAYLLYWCFSFSCF